ncbi:MAG: hypothetical protein IPJ06_13185 [Saprospiraceae bacterium]|nr:hypothetical protein [Saprospiraceae bacterium]
MRGLIIISFLLLVGFGCQKEECSFSNGCGKYNVDLGRWELLNSSLAKIPYFGKSEAIFVDSIGSSVSMNITELTLFDSIDWYTDKFDDCETGDTIRYYYQSQKKRFLLTVKSLNIYYLLDASSGPVIFCEEQPIGKGADFLSIWRKEQDSTSFFYDFVFSDVLNPRTSTCQFELPHDEGPIDYFGKTFETSLHYMDYYPYFIERFNYEYGIIALRDHSGKIWRFDHFIESVVSG